MKSIIALGVGLVVALAPAGTAFAAPAELQGTGKGKAYGNCQHSSATGVHDPLDGGAGNGNGGHVEAAKAGEPCVPVSEPVRTETEVTSVATDGAENYQEEAAAS